MSAWFKDPQMRLVMLLGFAIGVLFKFLLWHVWYAEYVDALMRDMPYRYLLQYLTGGALGAFAAAWGVSLGRDSAKRRK